MSRAGSQKALESRRSSLGAAIGMGVAVDVEAPSKPQLLPMEEALLQESSGSSAIIASAVAAAPDEPLGLLPGVFHPEPPQMPTFASFKKVPGGDGQGNHAPKASLQRTQL